MLCAQLGVAIAPAAAQQGPVQRGQEYYDQSRFDEAIALLRDLVDKGALSGAELLRSREILARAYVKKGYPVQAREMFRAILDQSPAYRPDPIRVPPDEMAVFEQARKEYLESQGKPQATPTERSEPAVPPGTPPATPISPGATPTPMTVKEGGGKKKAWWMWAAGAAVAVGVAAAVGGGGGGGGGTTPPAALPGFPKPPTP
jgi:tetratricopeptide (TPR) repeat protein